MHGKKNYYESRHQQLKILKRISTSAMHERIKKNMLWKSTPAIENSEADDPQLKKLNKKPETDVDIHNLKL